MKVAGMVSVLHTLSLIRKEVKHGFIAQYVEASALQFASQTTLTAIPLILAQTGKFLKPY
jgi:hypothetical protein